METALKKHRISDKQLAYLMITALFALVLIMVYVGRWAVPCADDYSYGTQVHQEYLESGSVFSAVGAAGKTISNIYRSWQGTFSACFMMAVQPAVFGESLYFLTPIIMLCSLLGGIFCLFCTVLPEIFGVKRHAALLCAACVGILCTQLVPSPVQGFYWYNGAVYYTFYYGLFLAAIALAVLCVKRGGIVKNIVLCFLCVFIGGGNYVTALSSVMLAVGFIALLRLLKDMRWKRLVLPAAFLIAAFAVSALAPGNAVRQATSDNSAGVVGAILLSFEMGARYSVSWLSFPLIGTLLFISPVLCRALADSQFNFRFPAIFSLLSYCLISAMFCPPIYAAGNVGDKRLVNIIYFAYVLLWVLNVLYWMGWIVRKKEARTEKNSANAVMTIVMLAVLSLSFALGILFGNTYTSLMALGLIRSGDGQLYYECAQRRTEILKDDSIDNAELEDYPVKPYLLFFDDVTNDPLDWKNMAAAEYYGKASVVLKGN